MENQKWLVLIFVLACLASLTPVVQPAVTAVKLPKPPPLRKPPSPSRSPPPPPPRPSTNCSACITLEAASNETYRYNFGSFCPPLLRYHAIKINGILQDFDRMATPFKSANCSSYKIGLCGAFLYSAASADNLAFNAQLSAFMDKFLEVEAIQACYSSQMQPAHRYNPTFVVRLESTQGVCPAPFPAHTGTLFPKYCRLS